MRRRSRQPRAHRVRLRSGSARLDRAADEAIDQSLRRLAFHIALGNNDAHAKNVALMHLPTGSEFA
jgi:serine/threonine protein kinase HipA of HipAB toxin-antitoxin module